jgi:hypothetical protein
MDEQEGVIQKQVSEIDKRKKNIEEELLSHNKHNLILLLQYSSAELEAYYTMGLSQTQRSFKYSLISMWIGFIVIITGIILNIIPSTIFGIPAPPNINDISIAGGITIELVSALFLWVYKNSISNQNNFYERQLYNHNVILAETIASNMQDGDKARLAIVEKLLTREPQKTISKVAASKRTKKTKA